MLVSEGMESEPSSRGAQVTKNKIIEKTLREIVPRIEEREELYSVMAELQERLPDTDIRTCGDFRHLNVTCCDTCHAFYPHYEMSLIDLPDGAKAWEMCIRDRLGPSQRGDPQPRA